MVFAAGERKLYSHPSSNQNKKVNRSIGVWADISQGYHKIPSTKTIFSIALSAKSHRGDMFNHNSVDSNYVAAVFVLRLTPGRLPTLFT